MTTGPQLTRRQFLTALAAGVGSTAAAARLVGQEPSATPRGASSASNVVMDPSGYREVRRPPKPGAQPVVTKAQSDALEHEIGCACPCTLDVYTCRTTDFSCGISPSMHRDVMGLVRGGYTADEIIAAFVDTYGEQVLMAPKKEGFNWAGYLAPFAALGTGAAVVVTLLKRWQRQAPAPAESAPRLPVQATDEELERIQAAVRREEP
jgi:cytochrome c-type biogenesis protein CcmH